MSGQRSGHPKGLELEAWMPEPRETCICCTEVRRALTEAGFDASNLDVPAYRLVKQALVPRRPEATGVSDATAFVEAAGSVEFGPRRSEAQNNQTVAQAVEWPAAVGTRDEGAFVERVCKLLSKVWHHFDPGSHQPNDCICLSRKPWQKDSFQHSQQSVAWLEALVERELGQRSAAAKPGGGT